MWQPLHLGAGFMALLFLLGYAFVDFPDREAYLRGKKVYEQRCFFCHGMQADGKGPLSADLTGTKPQDFRLDYLAALPPDSLKRTIREGGKAVGRNPVMPGWSGILAPQEIDDVVVFIQTVSRHGRVLAEDELGEIMTQTQ